ncbi:hypothetical protein [Gibbsiella quercinecans]|uniref:phage tail tape measure protein n=1 Tax=Gibbsiella quercinecans TaxID=929813 RepID=UPI003A4DB9D3
MSDKNLRLQVFLSAVDKVTRPFKSIQASNKALAASIKTTKDQLKKLDQTGAKLKSFDALKNSVFKTHNEMATAQRKAQAMGRAILAMGSPTQRQTRALDAQWKATYKLQALHAKEVDKLKQVRTELYRMGVSAKEGQSATQRITTETERYNHQLQEQERRLKQSAELQKQLTGARNKYQSTLNVRNQMVGAGLGMSVAGGATLAGLKPTLNEATVYSQHVERFRAQGVSEQEIARAEKFISSHPVMGNSQAEMMKLYGESYAITRDEHHTHDATVQLARAETAIKMLGSRGLLTPEQTEEFSKLSYAMLKNAELRNEIQDPRQFASFINESVKAFAVTQAMVTPEDTNAFMKTGGLAAKDIGREEYFYAFSHLIQEMGGERTGNALNSARQNWISKRIKERSKDEMDKIGLISNVTYSKTGHVKDFNLINQDKFNKTPFKYLMEEVVPRIEKAYPGLSEEGIQLKISDLFSNRTASDLFATMYNQRENIKKQMTAGTKVQDMDTILTQGQKTAPGQELILEAKKHDLYKNIGQNLLPLYVKGLEKVSSMLDRVNSFFDKHKQAAKVLAVTAAGFGVIMVAGGALTLALASLLGPIAMIRYSLSLLGIRGSAAARGVGRVFMWLGKSAISVVIGAFQRMGGVIVWLGRLMMANPLLATIGLIAGAAIWVWQNWAWLGPKLNGLWDTVSTYMQEKWHSAVEYVKSIPGKFKEIGTNIINTLMDGINEKWEAVKSKITSLTDYLPDWIKGKTDVNVNATAHQAGIIHSPAGNTAADIQARYTGAHDNGGRIPLGKFGVVGEYGPEIVSGPVNVTSRRTTASMAAIAALMLGGGMQPASADAPLHPYSLPGGSGRTVNNVAKHQGGDTYIDIHAPIQITAQPHHNPQDIAREVARQLDLRERQARARANSSYQDAE